MENEIVKKGFFRFVHLITGWGSWFASSWIFDDILYPLMIAFFGPIFGGGFMAVIAIIICWFWLKGIVASKDDWFGMEVLHKTQRIVFWIVRIAKHIPFVSKFLVEKIEEGLTFLTLNIVFDPMIATLYYRHGDKSKIITERDKKIFIWSAIISNGYWILRSWALVLLIKLGWNIVTQ